jgi:hypothetical protein
MDDVDLCRANCWAAGDKLIGEDGYGTILVELTGVSADGISARVVARNGVAIHPPQPLDTLTGRSWHRYEDPLPAR